MSDDTEVYAALDRVEEALRQGARRSDVLALLAEVRAEVRARLAAYEREIEEIVNYWNEGGSDD